MGVFTGVYGALQHIQHDPQHANTVHVVAVRPTSVGVLSLQTLSGQYVDLSDQLGVATHPRPTRLRRLVQIQLSGKDRVHEHVRGVLKAMRLSYGE